MSYESPSREGPSGSSAQKRAEKVAEKVAQKILTGHSAVLGIIVGRRLARETFDAIAAAESATLAALGATTNAVRATVVRLLCNQTLTAETEATVVHDIRSRAAREHANVITPAERELGLELLRLTDWTDDMDLALEQHATITLYAGGRHNGQPDWGEIAAQMNEEFSTNFTLQQWRHRFNHLVRMASRANVAATA